MFISFSKKAASSHQCIGEATRLISGNLLLDFLLSGCSVSTLNSWCERPDKRCMLNDSDIYCVSKPFCVLLRALFMMW